MRRFGFALLLISTWSAVVKAEGDYRFYNSVSGTNRYRFWIYGAQSGLWASSRGFVPPGEYWEQHLRGGNYYIRLQDVDGRVREVGWKNLENYTKADIRIGYMDKYWMWNPNSQRMELTAAAPSDPYGSRPSGPYSISVQPSYDESQVEPRSFQQYEPPSQPNRAAQPYEFYAANLGITYDMIRYSDGTFGARITRTPSPGSPAASIGLEPGDVIYALDGQRFTSERDVLSHRYQTTINLINIRNGQPQSGSLYIP